jgi:hypothetical protein
MSSLPDALEAAMEECREYLKAFPGTDFLPLNLFARIVAAGGDGEAIEKKLLKENK